MKNKNLIFNWDYTTKNTNFWKLFLRDLKKIKSPHYLEIGVLEGRSLIWFYKNIFSRSQLRAVVIDNFSLNTKTILKQNLKNAGIIDQVKIMKGDSVTVLRKIKSQSIFDLIYIDGLHKMQGALSDAILSWPLLKLGGYLIFDDYLYLSDYPNQWKPKLAIDTFLTAYQDEIQLIYKGDQVILQKVNDRNPGIRPRFKIGPYYFFWHNGAIFSSGSQIQLTKLEISIIKKILTAPNVGELKLESDHPIWQQKNTKLLLRKLKIKPVDFFQK